LIPSKLQHGVLPICFMTIQRCS